MRAFQLLVKPVSGRCSQSCNYCFYKEVTNQLYGSEEVVLMSQEVLEDLVSTYLSLGFRNNVFIWQGGEPTLAGLDFFVSVVEFQKLHGSSGQVIGNALQTNGALITEEWGEFLSENKFLVGLSIDGPEVIHDSARGKGTWKKAMQAAQILTKFEVPFNLLTVVHSGNHNKAKQIFNFMKESKFSNLQFIPAVDFDEKGNLLSHSTTGDEYGTFLRELFNSWQSSGSVGEVAIRFFDSIIENAVGFPQSSLCSLSSECASYLLVEANGDVYPCDFFVASQNRLGNIKENDWTQLMKNRQEFEQAKMALSEECKNCEWIIYCNGGCPKDRIRPMSSSNSQLCDGYREFFSYAKEWIDKTATAVMTQKCWSKNRPS